MKISTVKEQKMSLSYLKIMVAIGFSTHIYCIVIALGPLHIGYLTFVSILLRVLITFLCTSPRASLLTPSNPYAEAFRRTNKSRKKKKNKLILDLSELGAQIQHPDL